MNVEQLFEQLSYGEFSSLALGSDGSGAILPKKHGQILVHLNEGLLRLYSRFLLAEKALIIEQIDGQTRYQLHSKYAISTLGNPGHLPANKLFIQDSVEQPFKDDALKILAVGNERRTLPMNNTEQGHSVFTPQPLVLQVPAPRAGRPLQVTYQAAHPKITSEDLEAEIVLPDVLEGALKAFIAYRVFSNMGTQEQIARSQEHFMNFKMLCDESQEFGMVNGDTSTTNTRFENRGWK